MPLPTQAPQWTGNKAHFDGIGGAHLFFRDNYLGRIGAGFIF